VLPYRIAEPFLTKIGWAVVLAICLAPCSRVWRDGWARPAAPPASRSWWWSS
jgi:hypothetical protein